MCMKWNDCTWILLAHFAKQAMALFLFWKFFILYYDSPKQTSHPTGTRHTQDLKPHMWWLLDRCTDSFPCPTVSVGVHSLAEPGYLTNGSAYQGQNKQSRQPSRTQEQPVDCTFGPGFSSCGVPGGLGIKFGKLLALLIPRSACLGRSFLRGSCSRTGTEDTLAREPRRLLFFFFLLIQSMLCLHDPSIL